MAAARIYQRKGTLINLPIAVAALALMAALWVAWLPLPPASLTFSSGPADGAYEAHARRYAQFFAAHGVRLDVVPSEGSEENLQRLRAGTAQLAFLQGGTAHARTGGREGARIQSLARVDLEPVWIFSRVPLDALQQLQGLRVSLGGAASGTRRLATALLEQVRLTPADLAASELEGMAAVQALREGRLDAMIQVASPHAPVVLEALRSPGVHLVQVSRGTALIERLPYLQLRLLAQGSLDAGGRHPVRDTPMLVSTASLVTREDVHPALQRLAVQAAREVHAPAGVLHRAGEFPTLKRIEFPSSPHARQAFAGGSPWLERLLPFWWAQVALRVLVICVPVALLAWWLARSLPAYLRWLVESSLARWYGELRYIEHELAREDLSGLDAAKYLQRLAGIEKRMAAFVTPPDLVPRWFVLKQHVDFVRLRLLRLRGR